MSWKKIEEENIKNIKKYKDEFHNYPDTDSRIHKVLLKVSSFTKKEWKEYKKNFIYNCSQ